MDRLPAGNRPIRPARVAWSRAIASFERAEDLESARKRAWAALDLFGPDGRLNHRPRAAATIAAAVTDLTAPEWSKARNLLTDPRSLTFLDRTHRRLEAAEPQPDSWEAMAWRWWLRHGRPEASDSVTELLRQVTRDHPLDTEYRASYERWRPCRQRHSGPAARWNA
jgi:hypothetical protein